MAVAVSPAPSVTDRSSMYDPAARLVPKAGVVYVVPVPVKLYEYPVPDPPITAVRKNCVTFASVVLTMGGVPVTEIDPPVIFRADIEGPPPRFPLSTAKKYHPAESVSVPE